MPNKTVLTTQISVELVSAGRDTCERAVADLLLQAPARAGVSAPAAVVHDTLHGGVHRMTVLLEAYDPRRAGTCAAAVEAIAHGLCKAHPGLGFNIEVIDYMLYRNMLFTMPRAGCGPFTRDYYEQAEPTVVVHVEARDRAGCNRAADAVRSFMEGWGTEHGSPLRKKFELDAALSCTAAFAAPSAAAAEGAHAAAYGFAAEYAAAHPGVSISFDCDMSDAMLRG